MIILLMNRGLWLFILVVLNQAIVVKARIKHHHAWRMTKKRLLASAKETRKSSKILKDLLRKNQAQLMVLSEQLRMASPHQSESIQRQIEMVQKSIKRNRIELNKQNEPLSRSDTMQKEQAAQQSRVSIQMQRPSKPQLHARSNRLKAASLQMPGDRQNVQSNSNSGVTSKGFLITLGTILFITVLFIGLIENLGPGGSKDSEWAKVVLMILSAGALISSKFTKDTRRLKLQQALKNTRESFRRLAGTKGSSMLFNKIIELLKKENLKSVNLKNPDKLFDFARNFLRTKLGVKGEIVDQALRQVQTLSGING